VKTQQLRSNALVLLAFSILASSGCQPTARNTVPSQNTNTIVNANTANTNVNAAPATSTVDAREPQEYQATVKLSVEAVGDTTTAALPTISANVARNGDDRLMEFALPNGDKAIFLETGDMHYLILPTRKQYAEITRESVGMDVRRMMTPGQMVDQVKTVPGMTLVG
jgi:hypothetical protein